MSNHLLSTLCVRLRSSHVIVCLLGLLAAGCAPGPPPEGAREPFTDVTAETGLDFVHFNGMSGELYYSEHVGSGGALLDFDGDGDLDLYLVQGHMIGPGKEETDAVFPPRHPLPLTDRLYRNDLSLENGAPRMRLVDVTAASGLAGGEAAASGYGMGVATGDFDNDGDEDLYVTNLGSNQLWRNEGDGTFVDVTAASGADDPRWSTSAAFVDVDLDGWLDLFVVNYVDYRPEAHKVCLTAAGVPDYCGPFSYEPVQDRLLRNLGDGSFQDVSEEAGIRAEKASGLGIVTADFDGDGLPDLYVANDLMRNHLWINRGDGTFVNDALLAGCAVNAAGKAEASMGVDAGDLDNDGDDDLFMTHLREETNTLYRNDGAGFFREATAESRLAAPSAGLTGFGTAMLDFDADGWLDLVAVNGAVKTIAAQREAGDLYPLHQPNQLFRNRGDATFEEVSRGATAFAPSEVSRGAAVGDVDNDGDPDLLIVNNAGPARLLRNEADPGAAWLGVRLLEASGRPSLGGIATLEGEIAPGARRRVRTDGSYCSASDPRLLFGWKGSGASPPGVSLRWPGGDARSLRRAPGGRYLVVPGPESVPEKRRP